MRMARLKRLGPAFLAFMLLSSSWLACGVAVNMPTLVTNSTVNDVSTFSAGSRALAIEDDAILMEEGLYGQNADTYNPLSPAFQVAATYWLETMCRSTLQTVPVTLAYSWRSLGSSSCFTTPSGLSVVDPGNYHYCADLAATPSVCTHDGSLQSSAFVAGVFATLGAEPYYHLPFVSPAEEYWGNYASYSDWTEITPAMLSAQQAVPQIGDIIAYAPPTASTTTTTPAPKTEAGHVAIVVYVQPPQGNKNGYLILAGAGQPSNVSQDALPLIGYNIHPTRGNFYKVDWYANATGSQIIQPFNNEAFQGLIRFSQAVGALYAPPFTGYGNAGLTGYFAPYSQEDNLVQMTQASGASYITMAFLISGGGCTPVWGAGQDVQSVVSQIKTLQAKHEDVIISFGGADGQEPAHTCTNPSSLEAEYASVVTTYGVTHLDFDIEGGTEGDATSVGIRNQALAQLEKAYPKVQISYTLPVAPDGLPGSDIVLKDAIAKGVTVSVVNLMTMDYGSGVNGNQMGLNSTNSATATEKQLAALYPNKTSQQLWAMIGITPLLGINDDPAEVFTVNDANTVLQFAEKNKIGELSFWNLERDHPCGSGGSPASDSCSGTPESAYQFSHTFEQAFAPPT